MTLDELRAHAADLFPQATHRAIYHPGDRNDAHEALERLCWEHFVSLGFDCMADCFGDVAPTVAGMLSVHAWSSARLEMRGWAIDVVFQPLKFHGQFGHLEIFHKGPLPGVTDTGYLSRFIPMATFEQLSLDDVLNELVAALPSGRQLTLF